MGFIELLLLSVGLATDATAASAANCAARKHTPNVTVFKMALLFGLFQAGMPILGWYAGIGLSQVIQNIDHWIAFILLSIIGGKMILESLKHEETASDREINTSHILLLALATSIDALVIGVTFAFINVNLLYSVGMIGVVTFLLAFLGGQCGKKASDLFKNAEVIGGIILLALGLKILLDHLLN